MEGLRSPLGKRGQELGFGEHSMILELGVVWSISTGTVT